MRKRSWDGWSEHFIFQVTARFRGHHRAERSIFLCFEVSFRHGSFGGNWSVSSEGFRGTWLSCFGLCVDVFVFPPLQALPR